eukprot:scaffold7832_cov164-Amphora_coffeaeformis.AAC.7
MLWKQLIGFLIFSQAPPTTAMMSRSSTSSSRTTSSLPRILCLHGKFQTASSFANKIGGARRKLAREYELHFLDGPIVLEDSPFGNEDARAWWLRQEDDDGGIKHILVPEAIEYIKQETKGKEYCALLGFSQGGTLATALALSGAIPVQALVTAGAPDFQDVFDEIHSTETGLAVPKLHFAGETDDIIPVESTQQLCSRAGNGQLVCHEKGHLFPTKAQYVNQMIEFLRDNIEAEKQI